MKIVKAQNSDLSKIAQAYCQSFPNSLTTKVGWNYTKKTLEWYLVDSDAFLFWIKNENNCIGFCGGLVTDGTRAGSTTSVIQFAFKDAILGLIFKPWLFWHPEIIKNYKLIFKNIQKKLRFSKTDTKHKSNKIIDNERSVGLVVIAVLPEYQGKGFGAILLKEFERRVIELNLKLMYLSVRKDNINAINSYKKCGWKIEEDKIETYLMKKEL